MDLIALLTTWFWYVMAFAAGMLVAWLVTRQLIPARSGREAIDLAVDRELQDRADAHRPAPVGRRAPGDTRDDADADEAYADEDTVEVQR